MPNLIQVVVKCVKIAERDVMKYLLYKFFETQEYRKNFIDGLLYANKFSYFRTKENKTVGVADEFENAKLIAWPDGTHFVQNTIIEKNGQVFVKSIPYDKKPIGYKENQGFIAYRSSDYNVFCMSAILLNDDGIVSFFDKENQKNFGQYGVFIRNTKTFLQRICSSIRKHPNVNFLYGNFVEYIDYDKRDTIQKWTPFHKFSNLSEQQEFRIIFDSPCIGALRYDIGAIDDIAISIYDKNNFFDAINVGRQFIAIKND